VEECKELGGTGREGQRGERDRERGGTGRERESGRRGKGEGQGKGRREGQGKGRREGQGGGRKMELWILSRLVGGGRSSLLVVLGAHCC